MSRTHCDVVIVCFGASPWLERCVNAALAAECCGDVILVDHGQTGSLPSRLAARADGRVRVVGDGTNRGFGAGCNVGFAASNAELLAIVNPDCVIQPDAIVRMRNVLDEHPGTGLVGAMLIGPDGEEQAGSRRRVPGIAESVARVLGLHRLPRIGRRVDFNRSGEMLPPESQDVPAVSGACMLARRDVLQAVGGFDERFFLHFEDLDLCVRVREAGFAVRFEPRARAFHAKGCSSRDTPVRVLYHKHRSWLL
ncbi:MAG: glycosyltransferase family 2 protein, partial [Planctomycetes bacterium]|nr:glycosyltransferase family 2 protein [Planctomycetota bacterium]